MTTAELTTTRRQELEALAERNGGKLTPEQVVEFARDPETALHSAFTWDDTEAARLWRIEQASKVIRVAVTMLERPDEKPIRVRAFVSLSTDRGEDGVFRRIRDVMEDGAMTRIMLADAMRELNATKNKYSHLKQLASVWSAIESAAAGRG